MGKIETLNQFITHRGPLRHKDFPLILFWSEKAGCTNFAKWFFYQIGQLDEAIKHSVHVYRIRMYENEDNYYSYLSDELQQEKKDAVKLIRNPFKRAVSSFLIISHYCFSSHPPNRMFHDWERIYQLFYKKGSQYNGISFKQFLYYLEKTGTDINIVDGHIGRQYIDGEEELVTKYIKLEQIKKEIKKLEKKYHLKRCPDAVYAQKNDHNFQESMIKNGDFSDEILTRELLLGECLPKFESFYDQESKELCKSIFKTDFEIYEHAD
ncbi:sulfotransferase family 2 domain-containing protein [Bacillus gobiensis]|uniref:sulfotransferase family 2 domain-containing protein n=1 Tax=Bacillus gobiensis TaxID=1441095 RepID=UPI003D1ED819